MFFLTNENSLNNKKQGVQGMQAFAFCVVTVNDEHTKPRFKRKLIELKFKYGICTELR